MGPSDVTDEPLTAEPDPPADDEPPQPERPKNPTHAHEDDGHGYLATVALGALGVVYGDIGTSPLYAMRESFHGLDPTRANVLGILSLIVWALIIAVTVKYVWLILRADYNGEGGILALTTQVEQSPANTRPWFPILMMLGLFGTSLLYGDGMITPAISVLSAVEGLQVVAPSFEPYVIPTTICIIACLFLIQSKGTESVGRLFGPVMLVWFLTLAGMGIANIVNELSVFEAIFPWHAANFLMHNGPHGFLALGSIFLVATGGEALYADMGHFGKTPIRAAWFSVVFPCLLLNYFGQGALLIDNPQAAHNPFFLMVPEGVRIVVVGLATMATVIASQALISGSYSLTMQAMRLSYLPRFAVRHTSVTEKGQIYVPSINWMLMCACILLVLGFRTSSNLAAAYGVGVNLDMLIATTMFFVLVVHKWKWPLWKAFPICALLFVVEAAFMAANSAKIVHGGWFPLVVGGTIFMLMRIWKKGRKILGERLQARTIPLRNLLARLDVEPCPRVPGTAIFLYGNRHGTPPALLSNLRHNKILHERIILLAVEFLDQPFVMRRDRLESVTTGSGFYRIFMRFGYMDRMDIHASLRDARLDGNVALNMDEISYFLGKETLIPLPEAKSGMPLWQEQVFALMVRNATDATKFFYLPAEQVVELGTQVEI